MSDADFKYLVEEFGSGHLELLKQKDAYPYEFMNSFERFKKKKNCLLKNVSLVQQKKKKKKIGDDGKISDGHISLKIIWCGKNLRKVWNEKYGWLSNTIIIF